MENDKRRAYRRGWRAETIAAHYLRLKGYRIVARRFKTRLGEIDLIARRRSLIAIVEVKARSTLMQAHESVTKTAQRRIEAAADLWFARQHGLEQYSLRFDLIVIRPWRWPHHIKSFFTSN